MWYVCRTSRSMGGDAHTAGAALNFSCMPSSSEMKQTQLDDEDEKYGQTYHCVCLLVFTSGRSTKSYS